MSESIKLSFDDGYKSIEFNGDPNKVIRINPTDMSFVKRIAELEDNAKAISEKYGDIDLNSVNELKNISSDDPDFEKMKKAAQTIDKIEKSIRELIDSVFAQPVCDVVFGDLNCLSPANGEPIYINFIRVVFEYINAEIDKQNKESEAKISKYTDRAEQFSPKPATAPKIKPVIPLADPTASTGFNIGGMTQEEKNALIRQLLS